MPPASSSRQCKKAECGAVTLSGNKCKCCVHAHGQRCHLHMKKSRDGARNVRNSQPTDPRQLKLDLSSDRTDTEHIFKEAGLFQNAPPGTTQKSYQAARRKTEELKGSRQWLSPEDRNVLRGLAHTAWKGEGTPTASRFKELDRQMQLAKGTSEKAYMEILLVKNKVPYLQDMKKYPTSGK